MSLDSGARKSWLGEGDVGIMIILIIFKTKRLSEITKGMSAFGKREWYKT